MKLRNKKTGEIIDIYKGEITLHYNQGRKTIHFKRLEDLEEWEDAPDEPKTHWMIDTSVLEPVREIAGMPYEIDKEIGNWFSTKEEAELVIRKLKAWKRLKDKGFRFEGWDNTDRSTIHNFSLIVAIEDLENINKDLDLLFGGKK